MHVFYDGHCGVCHGAVKFLLARDPDGSRFRFAPLQGSTLGRFVPPERVAELPDSIVVITDSGELLTRSDGALAILGRLSGGWRWLGQVLAIVPRPFRDSAYDFIARMRKRLARPPADVCPMMPPELRARFDP